MESEAESLRCLDTNEVPDDYFEVYLLAFLALLLVLLQKQPLEVFSEKRCPSRFLRIPFL